jgi:hypothetical protein
MGLIGDRLYDIIIIVDVLDLIINHPMLCL